MIVLLPQNRTNIWTKFKLHATIEEQKKINEYCVSWEVKHYTLIALQWVRIYLDIVLS